MSEMTKIIRMPYSLWKSYYRSFPADQYDQGTKTIMVEMPNRPPMRWPKDWKRAWNHYITPGGCLVHFWGDGYARNYYVEHMSDGTLHRTVHPGIDSRQRVLDAVKAIERLA